MQKLCPFFSGAGPPRCPFRLAENASVSKNCETAVSAAHSEVFPRSLRPVSRRYAPFRSFSVPSFLILFLVAGLTVLIFWRTCFPTRCQQHTAFTPQVLRAPRASPVLPPSPDFRILGPCAACNLRTPRIASLKQSAFLSRTCVLLPPGKNALLSPFSTENHVYFHLASASIADGLQQPPPTLASRFSTAALVPLSLSFFSTLSSRLPFYSLPSILHVDALPPSFAAAEATAENTTAAPARTPGTGAEAETPAPAAAAAPGGPVRRLLAGDELGLYAAGQGRYRSADSTKTSLVAVERRRLAETDGASESAAVHHSSSAPFSLRSVFPFFSTPSSLSPPSNANGNKSPVAALGSKGAPPSSSVSTSTSFSSLPSSDGGARGGGDARSEQRETTGAAGAAAAADETETGTAGSNDSGGAIAAEGGTSSTKTKGEGLAASLTNVNMLLLALCLLCCFTLGYFIHVNMIPHLPDSAAAMLTGVAFGLLARLWGASPSENSFLHFDPEFFYFVLLPPIVLEAGFCLNKAAFLYNLGPILLLSILGTLLSTVIIAKVTLKTAHMCGLEGPPHELRGFSWVFASLISATDTVATLSIIGSPKFRLDEKGVDLYSILMGESVLNDAVSIALTRSCLRLFFTAEAEAAQRASGADVITDFLAVVVGSLVLGIGIGGFCCFCFRHSKLKKLPEYEVAITMLTAYMAFGVSECLGFSGVVSLFFCGVMLGHFNVHNMSTKSRNSIDTVFKTIALLSEKTVFAYLGVVAAVGVGQRSFNVFFVLIALSACAVSRAACVFPMSFISNRFRRKDERIDWRQQVLIWLAGLRGAVAFALAMTIPCSFDFWRAVCRHNKELVVTTTLVLVAITTLGVGSILEYTAVKLGVVQPRRRSLSLHGYGVAAAASSSSSAMLLLEHRQQQQALDEGQSNGDGSDFLESRHAGAATVRGEGREREGEEEGGGRGEEQEQGASTGAPRLFVAAPPSAGLRSEHETTASEELHSRGTPRRSESSQEMVTASALLRGPPPTAVGAQHQQRQQPGEAATAAHQQQQRMPAAAGGSPRSPSSEQLWRTDISPSPCPSYVRRADMPEAESDLAIRETFHRRHLGSGRFSRYDSPQHQPFNTILRFLYRLDREFLQPWLGSSASPSSSIVVSDAPSAAEARPDNGSSVLPGTVTPSYYRPDKAAAAASDRSCHTVASPQFRRQAQQ